MKKSQIVLSPWLEGLFEKEGLRAPVVDHFIPESAPAAIARAKNDRLVNAITSARRRRYLEDTATNPN